VLSIYLGTDRRADPDSQAAAIDIKIRLAQLERNIAQGTRPARSGLRDGIERLGRELERLGMSVASSSLLRDPPRPGTAEIDGAPPRWLPPGDSPRRPATFGNRVASRDRGGDGGATPCSRRLQGVKLGRMIRVAALDDHPAVLAGLQRFVEGVDGFALVAAAQDADTLLAKMERARPDVVILDYHLPRGDGLAVCQRLKERVQPPAVVVYSAYAGPALAVAARIAGADALIDKRAPASHLVDAIRRVAAGDFTLPEIPPEAQAAAMERLEPDDVPIAAMALAGTSHNGMAEALATDRRDVSREL
jgi:DNA-binding NarL/FixJ family response regulator